jgi:hypothetical protein
LPPVAESNRNSASKFFIYLGSSRQVAVQKAPELNPDIPFIMVARIRRRLRPGRIHLIRIDVPRPAPKD